MKIRISPDPTPQMVEAGVKKLAKLRPGKVDRQIRDIYKAMLAARPKIGRPKGSKDTKPRASYRPRLSRPLRKMVGSHASL
jgi:hypothetical protein